MLVIYNGECYDKNTLLSHLNKVVKQIEAVGDDEMPLEEHKACCLPNTTCQRKCEKCCVLHQHVEPPICHCFENNHHCCSNCIPPGITEICEREECSNCHHHAHPTICHHHPDRKCISIREKAKPQLTNSSSCPCCKRCVKNACLILPQICKSNDAKCKPIPCITFPEPEKLPKCKEKEENYKGNPFVIKDDNEHRCKIAHQSKNVAVIQPLLSSKKCTCENCQCVVKCANIKTCSICACNKTNGLQDNCKLCHMPRGRLGYLKTNK